MIKKIFIVISILAVISAAVLFFGRNQVKSLLRSNPQMMNAVIAVKAILSGFVGIETGIGELDNNESMTEAHFRVDFAQELGQYKKFWQGLGQDSFRDGVLMRSNRAYFELIGRMNQERTVLRSAHSKGMLCDRWHEKRGEDTCGHVLTLNEEGKAQFNWQITEEVIDLFLANGLEPLVSLTYMPSVLASRPDRVNPWNKSNISPPENYRDWQKLIYRTVSHLSQRYGVDRVRNWYFEVWNEPDLPHFFWIKHPDAERYPHKGDNLEYFKLYDYTAQAAKKALPDVKIGGPAIAGDIDFFINDWLSHCTDGTNYAGSGKGSPVDFISMHAYGEIEKKILPKMKLTIDKAYANGKEIVEKADFLVTEYGPTATPEPWLNTEYVAAWLVKLVDGVYYLNDEYGDKYVPDLMCFWTKPIPFAFDKHFGLVTAFGYESNPWPHSIVKRPVFNAFDALSRLGNSRIKIEGTNFGDPIHAIATKSGMNSVEILIYHIDESDNYNEETQIFPVTVQLQNLPFEQFKLEHYIVDNTHSNSYTKWQEIGSPERPSQAQLDALQKKHHLELLEEKTGSTQNDGTWIKQLDMKNNSICLLVLTETGSDLSAQNRKGESL